MFVVAALGAFDLLLYAWFRFDTDFYVIVKLTQLGIIALLGAKYTPAYQKIRQGTEKIASGDTNYKIDTRGLPKSLEEQAENLNSINVAVANAVTKQMRSEKLKTELITNVSHDIKTPLTSIINYIDLIKKENITQQPVADYIDVLGRQSDRLKKLIVDLVEASKASTGNITVHLATTGLKLLLNQASGEYEEKAEKAGLTLTMNLPEEEIYVLSDGRLLWRVFDNLLNNACKYSQPGTRVYVNLDKKAGKAVVTFRNVSRTQLNISPDELMERFVRGDSSRNTEGSGLGLNIAQSLTEILNGNMSLHIDGDLFKVVLIFDVI
ncbi:MAG: HAMP domain-containing histidine kinase [Oscillospiraceae bacterium]|nr:HAMP domain-containing histidine kinase [Oscillospiraceae bacterium]